MTRIKYKIKGPFELKSPVITKSVSQENVEIIKSCEHRGDQIRTMKSNICSSRGVEVPVYSCSVHGECTHRQACIGQDPSVKICIGCEEGPWSV